MSVISQAAKNLGGVYCSDVNYPMSMLLCDLEEIYAMYSELEVNQVNGERRNSI